MNDENSEKQISKEDRDLITLAVKCKFISGDQEKEVLGVLKSGLNDPSALSLINIFKGLKILSQDEIDFLFSVKEHLKNKYLDIKFGKLAVANRFTTPDIINKTLEQQVYEKRRLNLEKALFKFVNEVKINQNISRLFEYSVSKDKLEAYLCMTSDFCEEEIDAHSIVNWIKLMGIQFGIVKDSVIEQFLAEWTKGSRLKIAQGVAPRKGEDAAIEFFFDHHEKEIHDADEKEKELSTLCLEQDYLSLQEYRHAAGKFPEIKVKNQISEGTIVLGKSAKLTLNKTIYGVRLYERIDPKTNLSTIEIAGYFE